MILVTFVHFVKALLFLSIEEIAEEALTNCVQICITIANMNSLFHIRWLHFLTRSLVSLF